MAGFPWTEVLSFDLAEKGDDGAGQSSLYTLLEAEGGRQPTSEPYRLRWRSGGGVQSIRCERMAGVVAAAEAAARGVEIVIAPASGAGEPPCRLLTLLDYLSGAGPEQAAPPAPAKTPERTASPASREAARPQHETSARTSASGPNTLEDLGRLRAAAPRGSALVAVRYLPARVAITRVLRSLGWSVVQAPDNQELPGLLRLDSYAVVFAEPPDPLEPGWVEAARRVHAAGGSVVVVASRLRAAGRDPLRELGEAPRLLHPFREGEIERVLAALASPSR
jgi:hypothetical protein